MENATQQDALESEEVVEAEEASEDQPVEEINASVNPMSAREKALEDIYNRRREEEGVPEGDAEEVTEDEIDPELLRIPKSDEHYDEF